MKLLTCRSASLRLNFDLPLITLGLCCVVGFAFLQTARAADHSQHGAVTEPAASAPKAATKEAAARPTAPESSGKEVGKEIAAKIREAVNVNDAAKKRLTLVLTPKDKDADSEHAAPTITPAIHRPQPVAYAPVSVSRARVAALTGHAAPKAQASAHGHEVHWSYDGEGGPATWGQLKPEFNTCATGKRQSPIHIEEANTLQGPAEAIQFNYRPSDATVVNNGHTIQVNVVGDNSITVRGSTYQLLQFHFHHPSEERVNYKTYSMVAHLVHRNMEGQLAVVGVLLDPGLANALITNVWTYMPLDAGDAVRMPAGLADLNDLLPQDQRYYQFMGSLTTPPCTEGVLWMVLKQPITLGYDQLKLFAQLFPNNARPTQLANGRPVRNGQ